MVTEKIYTMLRMKAPFPYFGGKARVSNVVWEMLGDVDHYIEPFFGSGAVLLNRPDWHTSDCETVNDADSFICNVWRSLKFSPDETAKWADWPVNHDDLRARRKALIANQGMLHEGCSSDPEWHDPKLAGYWIWAASCWIGGGLTRPNAMPHISNKGMGIHSAGRRPHISNKGMGVHAKGKVPHISDKGKGVHSAGRRPHIREWFEKIAERFRRVRVVCGDWTQVCGGKWQTRIGACGMFFDPPYSAEAGRDSSLYSCESLTVAHDVREWCSQRGDDPLMRICLAGYEGEGHEELEDVGWRAVPWSAQGGYSSIGNGNGKENRHKERLWFSPHCLIPAETQSLFV